MDGHFLVGRTLKTACKYASHTRSTMQQKDRGSLVDVGQEVLPFLGRSGCYVFTGQSDVAGDA